MPSVSGPVGPFPLRRIEPPRPGLIPVHEPGHGHEDIQHAGVLTRFGEDAEAVVEGLRILARKLFRAFEAEQAQVPGHGRADVGQVGQGEEPVAADFGWVHGEPTRCDGIFRGD